MKITGITTRILAFEGSPDVNDGRPEGQALKLEYPLVCLHTDEGMDGWTMGYGIHGDGPACAEVIREAYFKELKGQNPLHGERLWQRMFEKQRHMYNMSDACVGILDVALWDLRGKVADMPIAALLGIARESVPSYATARSREYSPEEVAEEVKRVQQAGYHGYKLQLCHGPERDIPRFESAREAAGDRFKLMEDPAGGYNFQEALIVGRALDRLGFYWFEEPIRDRNMALLDQLAGQIETPVVPTETSALFELPNYIHYTGISRLRGDVLLKGGITGLRKAMGMAELYGMNLEIHTANAPLLDVANLHVACAASNNEFIESHHPMFRFGLKGDPLEIDPAGLLHLPKGPGLGVELDWDWIDDHTISEISC